MTTTCLRCPEPKSEEKFWKNKKSPDGLHAWCKSCHRAYYKAKPGYNLKFQGRLRAEKRQYVQEKKVAVGCTSCGEKHPACLEWHHTGEQQKEDSLARLIDANRPYAVLDAEMAKCVVLCSNCHRKQHWEPGKYHAIARSA